MAKGVWAIRPAAMAVAVTSPARSAVACAQENRREEMDSPKADSLDMALRRRGRGARTTAIVSRQRVRRSMHRGCLGLGDSCSKGTSAEFQQATAQLLTASRDPGPADSTGTRRCGTGPIGRSPSYRAPDARGTIRTAPTLSKSVLETQRPQPAACRRQWPGSRLFHRAAIGC